MKNGFYEEHELDINYFVELAKSHVGEIRELAFVKRCEKAGQYEIVDYIPAEPRFEYFAFTEKDKTPTNAFVGYYKVRLINSKFYNGKTFTFPVHAGVQDKYFGEKFNEVAKVSKAIRIYTEVVETGKTLKAYEFPTIDKRQYAE